jgi:hypothetical protein
MRQHHHSRESGKAWPCLGEIRAGAVLVLLVAAIWAIRPAAGADLVVVEAVGIDLKQGQILDDQRTLALRQGQRVTLLAADGNLLKLRGPYDRAPAAAAGEEGATGFKQGLKTLLAARDARTSEVGIVRNNAERVTLPEPWVVSAEHSGHFCIPAGRPVVFWRSSSAASAPFAITPLDRSWKIATTWAAGADRLTLPDPIPVRIRSTYLVDLAGNRAAITLSAIPPSVATEAMRAAWLVEKGCDAQAAALLASLP